MNAEHLMSIAWAVDRIMEASDDNISESGDVCDQVADAESQVPATGGRGPRREAPGPGTVGATA